MCMIIIYYIVSMARLHVFLLAIYFALVFFGYCIFALLLAPNRSYVVLHTLKISEFSQIPIITTCSPYSHCLVTQLLSLYVLVSQIAQHPILSLCYHYSKLRCIPYE